MRSSACAAVDGGFPWTTGFVGSLDRRRLPRCSTETDGSVGTVIRFQRIPVPSPVTVGERNVERMIFLARPFPQRVFENEDSGLGARVPKIGDSPESRCGNTLCPFQGTPRGSRSEFLN